MFYLLEHGWLFGVKKFKEKGSVVIEENGWKKAKRRFGLSLWME